MYIKDETVLQCAQWAISSAMNIMEDEHGEQTVKATPERLQRIDDLYNAICIIEHNITNLQRQYRRDIAYNESMLFELTMMYLRHIQTESNAVTINTIELYLTKCYAEYMELEVTTL